MGMLKNIFSVSLLTLLSRISGLLRDIFIFATFGTSELNSAFLFAFNIPNLFRRLLGEGALTSALIPVFADEYHHKGKKAAFELLDRVTSRLMLVLWIIVGVGITFCVLGIKSQLLSPRWVRCFALSAVLLPYMFFICLGALFAAVLNVFEKFSLHASNGIWLNLSMIIFLALGYFFPERWRIDCLCTGVLIGGVIQMVSLWRGLIPMGWKFHFNLTSDTRIGEVQRLFFPGVAGAAALQINAAFSRALAYFVDSSAVAVLYLANRLVELPLGLFVTAITVVLFPRLSRLDAQEEKSLLREEFAQGIALIFTTIFPAMVGMLCLDRTIVGLLFHWGNFTERDLSLVLPVLRICLLALPCYALSAYLVRGYHCKKNTIKPMFIATIHIAVNVILTLGLMFYFKSLGIALANLLAIAFQTFLLYRNLGQTYQEFRVKIWTTYLRNILLASCSMGIVVFALDRGLGLYLSGKMHDIWSVLLNIPLGIGLYFGLLHILKTKEMRKKWEDFTKKINLGK
jgi:putative peptidoglycan lipid II flippase